MHRNMFSSSRYFFYTAVVGALASALILMLYGVATVAMTLWNLLSDFEITIDRAKILSLEMVIAIDLFLLGTVLYITGIGIYELFIGTIKLPAWLVINSLDDLKSRLLSAIIVLLAITFLGKVIEGQSAMDVLVYGSGIALVVFSLAFMIRYGHADDHANGHVNGHTVGQDEPSPSTPPDVAA